MLHRFIRSPEFAEFNESSAPFRKNSIDERTCVTVVPDPAVHADLVSGGVARVVAEHVVSRTAEFRARRVKVIFVTFHSNTIPYGS